MHSPSHDDVKKSNMGDRRNSSTSTDTRDRALTGLFRKQEITDLPTDREQLSGTIRARFARIIGKSEAWSAIISGDILRPCGCFCGLRYNQGHNSWNQAHGFWKDDRTRGLRFKDHFDSEHEAASFQTVSRLLSRNEYRLSFSHRS